MERIVLTLKHQALGGVSERKPDVFFAHIGKEAERKAVELLSALRSSGIEAVMAFGDRSFKAQMREANTRGARFVALIGDSEMAGGVVQVKSMESGGQSEVRWESLADHIRNQGATR
jgi:histidyl-tRNA synthetase